MKNSEKLDALLREVQRLRDEVALLRSEVAMMRQIQYVPYQTWPAYPQYPLYEPSITCTGGFTTDNQHARLT